MQEYIDCGYASVVKDSEVAIKGRTWYIPHLGVTSSNKFRIVFDCSAKSSNVSLNDKLLQGPQLTNSLVGMFLRFRQEPIAVVGDIKQRWSRGHKARGQGQGHKKNPRPRTAFPRTEPLEAKDRNARGQGPRTQPQVFSKKKGLQKSFPGNLQLKGVARIFDWGGLNHKSHAMTSLKICLLFT